MTMSDLATAIPKEPDIEPGGERGALFLLLFVSVVVLLVVGLFYFVYRENSPRFVSFFVWYAALAAAMAIPAAKYNQCSRSLASTSEAIEEALERQKEDIAKTLETEVFPRVNLCDGLDEVCEMAAKVIRDAHKQKRHECRYVTFYGAASLAIPEVEYEEFGSVGGSGQQSPYQHYLGAIEAATGDKIRIRRYIRLFKDTEFGGRGVSVQREYVSWLKNQYNMLSRNPNYILADVVRAPQWGGNLARIITHGSMMELTGDGEGAIVITDDPLCETVRQYARETVIGGKDAKNKPVYYGRARECNRDLKALWGYLLKLEGTIPVASTSDEESED